MTDQPRLGGQAVVLSTRIRLARSLAGRQFPGWAKAAAAGDRRALHRGAGRYPRLRRGHVLHGPRRPTSTGPCSSSATSSRRSWPPARPAPPSSAATGSMLP
jgi:hypothetical protein